MRVGFRSLNRALTVPLLCSFRCSGFEIEDARQLQGGLAQGLVVQRRPQIDHVAVHLALQLSIAGGGFGEGEFGGGGLQVVADKGGIGAIACGVDADADTD